MSVHHGAILRILRDEGPKSRTELARRISLSPTALTHLTTHLLKNGMVREISQEVTSNAPIGRPATDIALVPNARFVIGIHVRATAIRAAVTDLKATQKAMILRTFDVKDSEPPAVVNEIFHLVQSLVHESDIDLSRCIGVGLTIPGPVDTERHRNFQPINPRWKDVPFADLLQGSLRLPVVVEHNVSAMALAESRYGIGRDAGALLYIYLRRGLGAGLVINGTPFRPGGRGAVELGHVQVAEHGEQCTCGNVGCLETFLSEPALARALRFEKPPARLLAALEKHPNVLNAVLRHLSTAMISATNLLNPDLIVFGGHLAEAPDSFIDHIRQNVPPRVLPPMRDTLRIERSSLGVGAGAIGGAAAALDHFFYSGDSQ